MEGDEGRRRVLAIPLIIFLCAAAGLGTTYWAFETQWKRNVDRQLELTATQAALRLQGFMHDRFAVVQSIGDYWALEDNNASNTFVARSLILQRKFGGFQALNWVTDKGVIELVVPPDLNASARGKSVVAHPVAGSTFRAARDQKTPMMTPPVNLFQGRRGVAAYLPVMREGEIIGYLNPVFVIDELVRDALGDGVLDSHQLRVSDAGSLLYDSEPRVPSDRPTGSAFASILNHQWALSLGPDDELWGTMRAGRPRWIFGLALALAAVASWLLRVALQRNWQRSLHIRERQELELAIERSTKMQALGRLAGGVAHDFNNILTAIIGNAEIIRLTVPAAKSSAADIIAASARASDLTRQLLAFSSQRRDEITTLDLNAEIRDIRNILIRLLNESITLEFDLSRDLQPVVSNSAQISQILVNLAVNGADAMPEGGTLCIRTRHEAGLLGNKRDASETGSWSVLAVSDTGVGMDAATKERIFEPFFTTKGHQRAGVGLGLATVYGIVQGLGGELHVESKLGEGSCFEVWLPTSSTPVQETRALSEPQIDQYAPRRILLVDDDASVLAPVAEALTHYGHTITSAGSGRAAMDILDRDGFDAFDLIATDAVMPGLSGPQLIRTLRGRGLTLPIILCSGYSEELAVTSELENQQVVFLAKPYAIAELLQVIRTLTAPPRDDQSIAAPPNAPSS